MIWNKLLSRQVIAIAFAIGVNQLRQELAIFLPSFIYYLQLVLLRWTKGYRLRILNKDPSIFTNIFNVMAIILPKQFKINSIIKDFNIFGKTYALWNFNSLVYSILSEELFKVDLGFFFKKKVWVDTLINANYNKRADTSLPSAASSLLNFTHHSIKT